MTFSFNENIPAAANNPSVDQPVMLTNNQSTQGIIGVDHVTFNTAGGGKHLQVTFNSNNPPTPPVSPPVLFTNLVDGASNPLAGSIPGLFYYSGTSTQSSSQYVSQTNGSMVTFGGIIIKWGLVMGGPSDHAVISFPVAFPNNCFTVVATPGKSGSFGNLFFTLQTSPTTTGFQIRTNGVTLDFVTYIAIGN